MNLLVSGIFKLNSSPIPPLISAFVLQVRLPLISQRLVVQLPVQALAIQSPRLVMASVSLLLLVQPIVVAVLTQRHSVPAVRLDGILLVQLATPAVIIL